jgi:hypothetical protein
LIHFTLLMNPSTMPLLQVKLHPLATASASSANELDKSDQFGNPTGLDSGFPLLQAHLPLVLAQQTTKILRKREHYGTGRVTLDKVLQIGCLLFRAALCRSDYHERNGSGRRRLVQGDRLFGNRMGALRTKGAKAQPKRPLRPCVSLSDNFLVQPGHVMAPLVPSRSQVG